MVSVARCKHSARERLRTAHVVPCTCAVPAAEVLASLWSEINGGVRAGAREGGHHWVRGATSPDVTRWMECAKLFKGETQEAQSVVNGQM